MSVGRLFERVKQSNRGCSLLAALGATVGAATALATLYLLGHWLIAPWLDSLPEPEGNDLFRAEELLVLFTATLLGPPIVLIAAWLGMRCARRAWSLDEVRPGRVLFALVSSALGGTAFFTSIERLGAARSLAIVSLAIGAAGFLASMASLLYDASAIRRARVS